MSPKYFVGVDLGTSGARAFVIDSSDETACSLRVGYSDFASPEDCSVPSLWWSVVESALLDALSDIPREFVCAISVSATSGTIMAVRSDMSPLSDTYMYSSPCPDSSLVDRIGMVASSWTPARSGVGGLSCGLHILSEHPDVIILHQADWLNYCLTGSLVGDSSSALKSGYDPVLGDWPDWVSELGLTSEHRVEVHPSGSVLGTLGSDCASRLGLGTDVIVVAGTTDGCASFLATGACEVGDGVTVLGTTLTTKLLSDKPVFAPESGVYSHRIGDMWLAGGASNSGGGSLLRHFELSELLRLSTSVDSSVSSGLDYYPLPGIGERFPCTDSSMESRTSPRPTQKVEFLHGLLDGLGSIEVLAYNRLTEMGAPPLGRLYATGGGTKNPAWMGIRARLFDVPLIESISVEAARGSALLAMRGVSGTNGTKEE